MDDCNSFTLRHPSWAEKGSDSSMDDCNAHPGCRPDLRPRVQIPLWTIVTRHRVDSDKRFRVQIPLWTIVTHTPVAVPICALEFRFLYGRL